ncbi:heme A synthase, partial [Amaricoccus sp.]|uniref:heme A synthase n=1 Tax=Amaricoccus sp. TaxID=1872485 RepID=UPI001B460488
IAAWLAALFALVVAMIVVGGLTRLTDSGLSITEWKPIAGALPPRDAAAWEAEFANYRAIPQFELTRPDMTLAEFKRIYWWEWGLRQLGRLIGLVWAAGFLWFLVRRRIPTGWTPRLLAVGLLGGLQGAVGWWMVASGLAPEMVAVASHRLAIHLGIAFVILGLLAWWTMTLRREDADLLQARRQRNEALMRWGSVLAAVAFVQILLGALVAGIDAGRSFPEWPLMAGAFLPPDAFVLEPGWRNLLDNPGLVQFNHRILGYVLLVLGAVAWVRSRRSALADIRGAFDAMAAMLAAQVGLGIVTVLYASPWQVAIVHQLGAVALFVLILRARFAALYPRAQKIARGARV